MKRIIKSAGLAALGMASVSVASAQDTVKPWLISAALKGFWDDNIYTYPGATFAGVPLPEVDSFGIIVNPNISYNFNRSQQTTFGVGYSYQLQWYEARGDDEFDHVHQFNGKLSHAFNERFSLDVRESFAIAQEPQVIDDAIITSPARAEGDNIRNLAGILFSAGLIDRLSVTLGYNNLFLDYEQKGGFNSRSALLDRMEHQIRTDLQYNLTPQTTGLIGYQFEYRDHRSGDLLTVPIVPGAPAGLITGDMRDAYQHFMYVGVRQAWSPQLVASLQGGMLYTRYEREILFGDEWGPYADGSIRWSYSEGSSIQLNGTHRRSATDIPSVPDQEVTAATISWTHLIFTKLTSTVVGQYQLAKYDQIGGGEGEDHIFLGGVNLTFQLNRNVAFETGYTYDKVDSDIAIRSFNRNRVTAGVRLQY